MALNDSQQVAIERNLRLKKRQQRAVVYQKPNFFLNLRTKVPVNLH